MKITEITNNELRKNVTKKDVERRAKSIKKSGLFQPIILNRDNVVVAGRTRFAAMELLGWEELEEGKHFIYTDANDKEAEFVENYHRVPLSLGDELMQIKEMVKEMSIKEVAQILGESELWVRRRLNLKNLNKDFQKALKDNSLSGWKIQHFEFIASFSPEDQKIIFERSYSFSTNMKNFKKEIHERLTRDISSLPWGEDGCGECTYCKLRNDEDTLFSEMKSNMLCSNTSYLNLKYEEWMKSLADVYKVTENYYANYPGILTQDEYTEDSDGEDAIIINGENIGKKIKIVLNENAKQTKDGKVTLAELKERKHRQRVKYINEEFIIPYLDRLKKEISGLIAIYGMSSVTGNRWDDKTGGLVSDLGITGDCNSITCLLELKGKESQIKEKVWEQVKGSIIRELKQTNEETTKFLCELMEFDSYDKFMDVAIEDLPDPKSWNNK